ncbi:tubulin-specific chaperone cofactor e-like protein [Plakobranchus ocellatus]|uniref:Tubulin-specific chaperone cofactor e-like protein n=1 Tax=Plakobranchus ocellatus TaxID=259542 RepID=A0AAV3YTX3_9GAST|nr:tubulin-specific chaperone cofactor e-like protein [Plakobranchus ocellatus]
MGLWDEAQSSEDIRIFWDYSDFRSGGRFKALFAMSSTEDIVGFEGHTDFLGMPLHRSKGQADNSESNLESPDINAFQAVRQSLSANTAELHSRLSTDLDSGYSTSVCQISAMDPEGHFGSRPHVDSKSLVSFVQAVNAKYQNNDDFTEATDNIVIIHTSGNIKTTASGTVHLPKHVSMSGQEISVAGDATSIQKMCARVTELDLMENNITCWDEVFNIIVCIPHLTFLNLTNNCLASDLPPLTSLMLQPLPCLTHLVLNNTGVTWEILGRLLVLFPRLVELHLGLNNYHNFGLAISSSEVSSPSSPVEKTPKLERVDETEAIFSDSNPAKANELSPPPLVSKDNNATMSLSSTHTAGTDLLSPTPEQVVASATSSLPKSSPPVPSRYPTLRRLFFSSNGIKDWREICRLGQFFPSLEYLLLSETEITELGDPEEIPKCFPHLKALGLGRTLLASWEEVEKLSSFPNLVDVRLSGVPFLEEFPKDERFQHTVALLPNIHTLNGSKIGLSEREDAERAYLRRYMDAEMKPSRYYALEKQYGRLDPLAQVELKPQKTVKIKVRVEDAEEKIVKQEEMDIELDQTVRTLRKLLSNMTGRPAGKVNLFYMDNQVTSLGLDRLIYLDRKLHSYGMADGDEIVVAYKD